MAHLNVSHWPLDAATRNMIVGTAAALAERVVSKGRGPGSLEPEETAGLDYRVVKGSAIHDRRPELWNLAHEIVTYTSTVLGLVELVDHRDSAVNINVIMGLGARYEKHVDSNPVTAVLFVNTVPREFGGALKCHLFSEGASEIQPGEGMLVVLTGDSIAHEVLPLTRHTTRVSLVVSMKWAGQPYNRDPQLDRHLFGAKP